MHRFIALLFIVTFTLLACGSSGADNADAGADAKSRTVIYFSRHAEKGGGQDPDLLPAGRERAERLGAYLAKQNIAAVYATGYNRTRQTAAPAARAAGVEVTTYSAAGNAAKLTQDWVTKHRGETIFVVGHSNTVPGLVNALVAKANYPDIDESDYDNLFRVVVGHNGKGKVRKVTY